MGKPESMAQLMSQSSEVPGIEGVLDPFPSGVIVFGNRHSSVRFGQECRIEQGTVRGMAEIVALIPPSGTRVGRLENGSTVWGYLTNAI